MSDLLALARPELLDLPPYSRAEDVATRARLDANEVPWRPARDRGRPGLNRYPPVRAAALELRLAEIYGVPAGSVVATRGSDEAIDLLVRVFCRPGRDAVVVMPPTFAMYALAARVQGARTIELPRRRADAFAVDLDGLVAALDDGVKLVFVADPDNPTGRACRTAELEGLAARTHGRALLVVDEAYAEFAGGRGAAARLSEWPHLVVLRTLSKAHALAGARCGAAIARPEVTELLGRILPPFALARPSIRAALAQLAPAALAATRRRVAALVAARERLARRLAELPAVARVFPSAANFLLVAFRHRPGAEGALARAAIAARGFDHPELADCLRITVGNAAENRRLLAALAGVVSAPVALVDRDGTLVVEPPGEQLDAVDQVRLATGVVPALGELVARGYRLIVVTNQDGLGSRAYPRARWEAVQSFVDDLFASQGIRFEAVLVCPHRPAAGCRCRKPQPTLVDEHLRGQAIDRERSAVVGDRESDLELARRLGLRGFRVAARGDETDGWPRVVRRILDGDRRGEIERRTGETAIRALVDLAAGEPVRVSTGLGMLDHLLEQLAVHGGFALDLTAAGDLEVDAHHTVEDVALALGEALRRALGGKRGIARYGFTAAMDESVAHVALDLSGRPYARFRGRFAGERVGALPTALAPHFFRSLATALGAALHVEVKGEDDHHRLEACFKGVGRALRQACRVEGSALPTTKGVL